MSDLHIEHERHYWREAEKASGSDRSPAAMAAIALHDELLATPGHPTTGPDLRPLKLADPDILLLAGNIDTAEQAITYADQVAIYLECPVFVCAGNHEFYGQDINAALSCMHSAANLTHGRVAFLENAGAMIELHGRTLCILGSTLWTDHKLGTNFHLAMLVSSIALADYRSISANGANLTPAVTETLHAESRQWLSDEILRVKSLADAVVVMTHHAPVPASVANRDRRDEAAFASDLRQEILDWEPDLWVWGHTHFPMRGALGTTRLLSAPRGYFGRDPDAATFEPAIIDI